VVLLDQISLLNYINVNARLCRRKKLVYDTLKMLGGRATSWELLNQLGLRNPNIVRPRLTDLKCDGLIIKIGTRYNEKMRCTETIWGVV